MKKILLAIIILASCSSRGTVSETPEGLKWNTTTTIIPEETIKIVAVGDVSCSWKQRTSNLYDCKDGQVAQLAENENPNFVFALGDIQYPSHNYDDFVGNFFAYWKNLMPIIKPIAGNHEYDMNGASGYYKAWTDYPKPGYYSFDINKKWHVVALNTNDECSYVLCNKGSDQYEWLKNDLEANKDKCIIAMGHHPRYSSGAHGSTEMVKDVYDLMNSYSVEVYLSGHDHHYERITAPVTQFVVGTGGKDLRGVNVGFLGKGINSSFATSKYHGALVISIIGSSLLTKFISVDGKVFDQYGQNCQK